MTNKITSVGELCQMIEELEKKADLQKRDLKNHFSGFMENLKPANLIKHGLQAAFSGSNRQDLLRTALGLGSGILGRKLLAGRRGKSGLFRKIIGAALEFGVFGMVARNAEKIKERGSEFIEKFLHKRKSTRPRSALNTKQPVNYSQKN